jgi:hypothetical protein
MAFFYSPKLVTNGLVLYLDAANSLSYPGSGTIWTDLSRSQVSGSLLNGSTYNSANNGSIVFDGTNDYANLGNIFNFELTSSFTISTWFKTTKTGAVTSNIIGKCKLQVSPSDYTGYQIGMNVGTGNSGDAGKFGFVIVSSPFSNPGSIMRRQTTTSTYNNENWVNGTVTYDGSSTRNGMLIYMNGILATMENFDSTSLTGTIITNANFEVGARDGTQQPFNGSVSNATVYNRALSADEVLQNYNATKGRFGLT